MQVYADNAATTRMSDKALAAMTPYFQDIYGNPSSLHTVGQRAAEACRRAAPGGGLSGVQLPGDHIHLRRQRGR